MHKIVCFMLFVILSWAAAPDLQAPEISLRDTFGFDPYIAAEGGAILDRDGAIKGWVHGYTVYDAQWNIKYYIRGNRVQRVEE